MFRAYTVVGGTMDGSFRSQLWQGRRRTTLAILGLVLRAALLTLPLLVLRAMLWPREHPLSGLTDHQLGDIGLLRDDVVRPHERTASAELDMQRLLQGGNWR